MSIIKKTIYSGCANPSFQKRKKEIKKDWVNIFYSFARSYFEKCWNLVESLYNIDQFF